MSTTTRQETQMTTHHFTSPAADTREICTCGAAFVEGYNLHVVKIAHLAAFLTVPEVTEAVTTSLTAGQVRDAADGTLRFGQVHELDVALWNAAIDRENGYVS